MTQSLSKITAVLTAFPGKAAELRALLIQMKPNCRSEPGNLRWDVWRDSSQEGRFIIDELYRDAAAVEAHKKTSHYQSYLVKIPELAERLAWMLAEEDVT